jgi:1,4-alpha-glucan branching enzyme
VRGPALCCAAARRPRASVFWRTQAQGRGYSTFLDVVHRLAYLNALGVTAVQLLPIQEYDGDFGLGYNGVTTSRRR